MSVKREGKGMIIPKYRTNAGSTDNQTPCTYCFALYNKTALWHHVRTCKSREAVGSKLMKNQHVTEGKKLWPCSSGSSKTLRDTIQVTMREDDIKVRVASDDLIKQFGCSLLEKLGTCTDLRFRQYVSQKLTELARAIKHRRDKPR